MHVGSLGIFKILLLATLAHILQRAMIWVNQVEKDSNRPPLRHQEPKNHHKMFKNIKSRVSKDEAN